MTRDEIIRMARETGLVRYLPSERDAAIQCAVEFATMVAAAEREACAKLCEDNADCCHPGSVLHSVLGANAAAIRARSQG